eukprot:975112_1
MPGSEEHLRGSKSDEIDVLLVHDMAKWGGGRVKITDLQRSTYGIVKLIAKDEISIVHGEGTISVAEGGAITLFPDSLGYDSDGGVQVDIKYDAAKTEATIKLESLDFEDIVLGVVGTCIMDIRDNGRVRRLTAQLTVTKIDGSGGTVDQILKVSDRPTPFVVVLHGAEYARNVLEDDRIDVLLVHGPDGCVGGTVKISELDGATESMHEPMKVTASTHDIPFPVGCMIAIQSNTVESRDGGKVYVTVVVSKGDLLDAAWAQRKNSTYTVNVAISLRMIVSNADDDKCQIVDGELELL